MKWLFVCAHPDDLEFFVGHLMVALANPSLGKSTPSLQSIIVQYLPNLQSAEVRVLSMTRGEMSGFTSTTQSTRKSARVRTFELNSSCKLMGLQEPDFLGFIDGFIRVSDGAIRRMADYIERAKPDIVVVPEPVYTYYYHPDHIRTGKIAYYAIRRLKMSQKHVPRLYYFGSLANTFYFPKLPSLSKIIKPALAAHRSQATLLTVTRPFNIIASLITGRHVRVSWHGEGLRLQLLDKNSRRKLHVSFLKRMILYWAKATMYHIDYTKLKDYMDGTLPIKIMLPNSNSTV
jgi:LmbE family N-acetylglucosaminyl deacetylase